MNRTLLWDAAPGEIRAGLIDDGKLAEFRIFRLHFPLSVTGLLYTARLVQRQGAGKAIVDIGRNLEAQLENAPNLPEGALLAVELIRAPLPEPGRWKMAVVRPAPDNAPLLQSGAHEGESPKARFLRHMAGRADRIVCGSPLAVRDLQSELAAATLPLSIDAGAIEDADFDSLIDQAVRGEYAIPNGMLSIERTRSMTMIDIDGSGDPVALNMAAAREIPRLLRLLDIGGQIGIDFLATPDRKARQSVDTALADACAVLGPHERTAINGFGFAQIVRPRTGPSIPEILCETEPGRASAASRAIALLRLATRSSGHGKRQLVAPPVIIDRLRGWPDALAALASALGVEIELVSDSSISGYGHVHVSQS